MDNECFYNYYGYYSDGHQWIKRITLQINLYVIILILVNTSFDF